jgi:hypothetical protein
MDEYDGWSPLVETDSPHIDLRRRVHLSGRAYEVSACGGGHEPVAVRLTGRNAGGFIVTDLRGEVLPQDLADVGGLLQATLDGVAAATRRDVTCLADDLAVDLAGAAEGAGQIEHGRFVDEADLDEAGVPVRVVA